MAAPKPSARARAIAESATLALMARAQRLRAEGKDVVSLTLGEPDFPTPAPVAEAGIQAIKDGRTRYTPAAGIPELRAEAARWFLSMFGLQFAADEILVTAGAKPALHMALTVLLEPGERVLLPAPYWVSYPDLVRISGGEPAVLPPRPEQGFVPTAEQIAAAAREHRARGLILNYPNNPSGAVPSRAQLAQIVQAAIDADLWILSDEIYATMTYDGHGFTSPAHFPAARDRVLVVTGGTKSHSLTGWRIGFLAGPRELIAAAGRAQSQAIGNACTISQEAMREVCRHEHKDEIARRMQAFAGRRDLLVERINKIPGLRLSPPQGAFYALVDARELLARLRLDDATLAERLLAEQLLAVVPGSAFAIPGFLRLSYATDVPTLEKAVDRLRRFVELA
jgi:aspartate aminotransferase